MKLNSENGYTIIEMITVMAMVGVLSMTVIMNIHEFENPAANAAFSCENYLRLARTNAVAHTEVIVIKPVSSTKLNASKGDTCSGTVTPMTDMSLTLPHGATFATTSWTVCLTQRGLADSASSFDITDIFGTTKTVKVALGGGTMIE